jgi:hypothetical protein
VNVLGGGDIPLLIELDLALVHEVLHDLRGTKVLLDVLFELGYLLLHVGKLLQLLLDLYRLLLVGELLLLDLSGRSSPLGADL